MIPVTSTIAMSLTQDIRREHEAAQRAFASAVEHAVRCGELLAEAKAQIRHGEWLPWLAENFPASVRTAQGYMRLAAQPNAQALAHLGIEGALRQLAAPPAVHLDEADERRLLHDAHGRLEDTESPEECTAIADEARGHLARLEDVVGRGLSKFRADLRALHAGGAGIALGYPTWQAFVEAEFPTADWPPEIADMLVAELLAPDVERAPA